MKSFGKVLLLLMIVSVNCTDLLSQSAFNIHIGPSISLSDSGPYSYIIGGEEIISSPGVGFDVGIKYSYQWSEKGFGAFTSFDFILNWVNGDYKDAAERFSDGFATTLVKLPVYLNLPLSAGLVYTYKASDKLSVSCNPGITVNFMTMTDYKWNDLTITLERDWSTSIGFRIGLGLLLNERVSLDVDYLGLGNHKSVGRSILEGEQPQESTDELNIQLLTITAGWNF